MRPDSTRRFVAAAVACACVGPGVATPAEPAALTDPRPAGAGGDALRTTSGEVARAGDGWMTTRSATMRAEMGRAPHPFARLDFVYRGPTDQDAPLASGELRRQIGIKLRAKDTCNVVYAMWHVAPTQRIEVSVKANPGQSRHAECRDRGYVFVKPAHERIPPAISVGERHALLAALRGDELEIVADGATVWRGDLPRQAFGFDGPVGVRSDNGVFDFRLRAWGGEAP